MRSKRQNNLEKLRDWIIWFIVNKLNDQTPDIKVVFRKPRGWGMEDAVGLVTPKKGGYLVNIDPHLDRDGKNRTFLHEVLHIVFDLFDEEDNNDEEERATNNLEDILWSLLTVKEKKILEEYMYDLAK